MKRFILIIPFGAFIILLILMASSSCTHPVDGLANLDTVCFDTQVQPIIQINCAKSGCHDGTKKGARHTFTEYDSLMKYVVPGDPKNSRIYSAVTSVWSNLMPPPPAQPLTEEDRSILYIWIAQGAKNNSCY